MSGAPRWPCWLPAALVFAVTVLVFGRLAWCDFTAWDDPSTIADNRLLRPPSWHGVWFYWTTIGKETPGELYTPVTYTVWSAVAAVAGVKAWAYHGANVLLHATAAVVAYGLLRRLLAACPSGATAKRSGATVAAGAGALLFALHPVQVESVGWASGTKDVLCGLFAMAALWAYVGSVEAVGRGATRRRYALATLLFGLAMLSKPTALVVPLMAAVVDHWMFGRPWPAVARRLWPWAVLMVPCVLWTRAAQQAPWASPVAAWTRPLVAADAVAFDLGKLAWPARLCVDYGRRPVAVYASGALGWTWAVPAVVAGLILWRRSRPLTVAGLLFALPLVPVSGLVPFDFQFYSTPADHYLYLPMFGVALAGAMAVAGVVARWPAAGRWGAAVVLAALGVRSAAQTATWQDTQTVFAHVLAVNPRSFIGHDMLGYVATRRAGAIVNGRQTVRPSDPEYPAWRAELERALAEYHAALRELPEYVPSLVNLALTNTKLDRPADVRAALRRVAELQPRMPAAMKMDPPVLGQWLVDRGEAATAVAYLRRVVRDDPGNGRALYVLAEAQRAAGRP